MLNTANWKFLYVGINNGQIFISPNFDCPWSIGRTVQFLFNPLGFEAKMNFDHKASKINRQLGKDGGPEVVCSSYSFYHDP